MDCPAATKTSSLPLPPDALLAAAAEAASFSHSPYSHFPVGAALLLASGEVVTGCNVENASFGLTNCAERTALFKAVSEGKRDVVAMAVWAATTQNHAITPCGACRQVMLELLPPETPIYTHRPSDAQPQAWTVAELFPHPFDAAWLPERTL